MSDINLDGQNAADHEDHEAKKPYTTPALTELGKLDELTWQSGTIPSTLF